MQPTKGLAQYVAASIARSRLHETEKERDRLLQQAQLEGGLLVEEADGLASVRPQCPACSPDKPRAAYAALRTRLEAKASAIDLSLLDALWEATSTIEVVAPFGLRAREIAAPPKVDASKLSDETLLWAIRKGALKLAVNSTLLREYDKQQGAEYLEMLPRLGLGIELQTTDRLERVDAKQLEAAA